jgi:hypothetical protein
LEEVVSGLRDAQGSSTRSSVEFLFTCLGDDRILDWQQLGDLNGLGVPRSNGSYRVGDLAVDRMIEIGPAALRYVHAELAAFAARRDPRTPWTSREVSFLSDTLRPLFKVCERKFGEIQVVAESEDTVQKGLKTVTIRYTVALGYVHKAPAFFGTASGDRRLVLAPENLKPFIDDLLESALHVPRD